MSQIAKTEIELTKEQQIRKDVWSGALDRAGIPAADMDWKQAEVATPLYATESNEKKQPE